MSMEYLTVLDVIHDVDPASSGGWVHRFSRSDVCSWYDNSRLDSYEKTYSTVADPHEMTSVIQL